MLHQHSYLDMGETGRASRSHRLIKITLSHSPTVDRRRQAAKGESSGCDCRVISTTSTSSGARGWVIDLKRPKEGVFVQVFLGERLLGIVPADLERPDLLAAGLPRGNCMFLFRFPSPLPRRICLTPGQSREGAKQPLGMALGSFQNFQAHCGGMFLPHRGNFQYSWWSTESFEEYTEVLALIRRHQPPSFFIPAHYVSERQADRTPSRLPTFGLARDFCFLEDREGLGYQARIGIGTGTPFNDVCCPTGMRREPIGPDHCALPHEPVARTAHPAAEYAGTSDRSRSPSLRLVHRGRCDRRSVDRISAQEIPWTNSKMS